MASESFGGCCILVFAAEAYDQNAILTAAGITPINLQSITIGNGLTDFHIMLAALCRYAMHQCSRFFPCAEHLV
ncbi:hypothetical protein EDB19DRAFT_155208 [Suillus lakei]|nr:hypothetical protein EDB19DRAFT_155208 [Suillus lakei]